MRTLYNDMITKIRFLITDESIHITKQQHQKRYDVGFIKLSSINAYRFYKRPLDNRGDRGSVIIFYDHYFVSLKLINIPYFSTFQKAFESILFHFSGIVRKDSAEEATSELKFPIEYHISTKQLRLIQKYVRKIIRDNIWIFIITFIACFLIALFISFLIPIMAIVFFILMIICLSLLTGLLPLIRITRIKKGTKNKENTLELHPNRILIKNVGEINTIIFNSTTYLDFIRIYTLVKRPKERFDTVIIKERFDSKSKLVFGPIEEFSAHFKTMLSSILVWKIQNGFLFNSDELINGIGIRS
jgi:ABC-type multidrug transport system fused ATPase/permease subunit